MILLDESRKTAKPPYVRHASIPQLKREALRNVDKPLFLEPKKLIKYGESKLKAFCEKVKTCKKSARYLYWCKDKKESENSVTATFMSCKKIKYCSSQEFASDLLVSLRERRERMISQYQQIKDIKKIVSGNSQKCLCIRVDWSQNVNLFQARQEKGEYYHELQVSISAVVVYMSTNVSSHCTISDAKSHKCRLCGLHWRGSLAALTLIGCGFYTLSLTIQLVSTVTNIMLIWQKNLPSNII